MSTDVKEKLQTEYNQAVKPQQTDQQKLLQEAERIKN